jgi:hypothetical protein
MTRPTETELQQIDRLLHECDSLRRDPASDWHRGPQRERDFLRRRELELLELKSGECGVNDVTPVSKRDQDLRGFEALRRDRPDFWHSGSEQAEQLRARERALLEEAP